MALSRRHLLFGILVLAGAGLPALHTFLVPGKSSPPPVRDRAIAHIWTMDGIRLDQHQGARPQLSLQAAHAFSDNPDERLLLTKVSAQLLDRQGKAGRIQGDNALYAMDRKELTLTDNVVAAINGFRATAAKMLYYPDTALLRTSGATTIVGDGLQVNGHDLTYDLASGKLALGSANNRVRCSLEQ